MQVVLKSKDPAGGAHATFEVDSYEVLGGGALLWYRTDAAGTRTRADDHNSGVLAPGTWLAVYGDGGQKIRPVI